MLEDCQFSGADAELLIVEGESGGSSVLRARDERSQAVLPMQGKPMNATKADRDDIEGNEQFAALIEALGCGIGDECRAADCRYGRIVLLFDADADGIHSRTLMLLFFHQWMAPLLTAGVVHDVFPPLWKVECDGSNYPYFARTDTELQSIREMLEQRGVADFKTRRYRGVGSMGAEVLRETCLNPVTRKLHQLRPEHAADAMQVFEYFRNAVRDSRGEDTGH